MFSKIREDANIVPKTVGYKFRKGLITLSDKEEACTNPWYAYLFARFIPGADIGKCQEASCKNPWYAYYFARDIPRANIEKCQEATCKNPEFAYHFALNIPGANKEKCRKVCEGTQYAF